jgi:hypothetical protein
VCSSDLVLRNVGVALGHSLIAWRSAVRGLAKIDVDAARIADRKSVV